MKTRLYITLGAVFAMACNQPDAYRIAGDILNFKEGTVYLEHITGKESLMIDSVKVDENGHFQFSGRLEGERIYRLTATNQPVVDLYVDKGSDIKVKIDNSKQMGDYYTVEGSAESGEIKKVKDIELNFSMEQFKLNNELMKEENKGKLDLMVKEAEKKYQLLVADVTQQMKDFIKTNTHPVIDAYAAYYIDPNTDFAFVDELAAELKQSGNQSSFVRHYLEQIEELQKTAVGRPAPEISLPDMNGKTITLSSLRGKYVLIDFWASWCGPCREENPNVVRLYNKFKGKGFEIYGVSLDKSKEKWAEAIKKDGLSWLHVSDLNFWESIAAREYKVDAIPATFLLDKDGIIIAKNLRGKELEDFLAKLFS